MQFEAAPSIYFKNYIMNPFDELFKIEYQLKTLCPFDNHNEIVRLNEIKAKTQEQINNIFEL